MTKYLKVMFDNKGANFEYKINKINVATIWNPNTKTGREFGGFNFSDEEHILRWLHRGDTLYDVILPDDAEVIDVLESATPHGVFRSNKIIVTNPRKMNDDMALEFYKKSKIPDKSYPKSLAVVSIMNYRKTALAILKDKVNKNNIDYYLAEWNDFINNGGDNKRSNCNELVKEILDYLIEIKSDLLISRFIDKEPYIKNLTDDKIINLTGQSGSGKSTYAINNFNSDEYLVIDTDEIFSDHRFEKTTGINKELGIYFRNKYSTLPSLYDDFDLIYKEIISYCNKYNKTLVIDTALFPCIKNINLLKGKIIILRTSIDNCYNRCIERFKNNNPNYTDEELNKYKIKKEKIYIWYKGTNEFIKKVEMLKEQ